MSSDLSVSRFAKQIAEIEKGLKEPVITVGNLDAKRDFTDVRDMARAYILAAEHCTPGEAYNIGTGTSHVIGDVLKQLIGMSNQQIEVKSDESLFRPSDIPELRADASKFKQATGWEVSISFEKTLEDLLAYWRNIV
jgi:GDP-4-dehydro-6-deoxy-D-mannose reductase